MKTRAAVLRQIGLPRPYTTSRPLEIVELDLDPPGKGELLVKITAAGLCHSDLSVINGSRPRPVPMALGHEAAGIVQAIGEGVDDIVPDDRVVMIFAPNCGRCIPCHIGRPALCEAGARSNGAGTLLSGGCRLHQNGEAVYHHMGVAAFSDYIVVDRRSCVKVDRDLAPEHAALFGCAVLTGVGAVINTAGAGIGSRVAVIGLGGVGLAAVIGARAAGAGMIIAVDRDDAKCRKAYELGADFAVNAQDPDAVAQIRDYSGDGVSHAIETAGAVAALELAFAVTRRGGVTVTASLPHPDARVQLPAVVLTAEERTLKGSYLGGSQPQRDIPHYIELFRQGRLPVDRLLTHRLTLDEIDEGFDRLADGKAVRQVILFS